MRHALTALALGAACTCTPAAIAQHCHPPAPAEPGQLGLSVEASSEFATYRNTRYEGEYQGLTPSGAWQKPWLRVELALPAYRLTRNGPATYGLGDLFAEVRVPFARSADDTLVGGAVLAGTLPTGDADRDLGMGHVMLMPALWTTWTRQPVFVSVQAGYGRALASSSAAHHQSGTGAIVNPMNMSEVELAFAAGIELAEPFRLRAGATGAVPVAAQSGRARATALLGVDLRLASWFETGVEGHLPLAGDPFLAKMVALVGARF